METTRIEFMGDVLFLGIFIFMLWLIVYSIPKAINDKCREDRRIMEEEFKKQQDKWKQQEQSTSH